MPWSRTCAAGTSPRRICRDGPVPILTIASLRRRSPGKRLCLCRHRGCNAEDRVQRRCDGQRRVLQAARGRQGARRRLHGVRSGGEERSTHARRLDWSAGTDRPAATPTRRRRRLAARRGVDTAWFPLDEQDAGAARSTRPGARQLPCQSGPSGKPGQEPQGLTPRVHLRDVQARRRVHKGATRLRTDRRIVAILVLPSERRRSPSSRKCCSEYPPGSSVPQPGRPRAEVRGRVGRRADVKGGRVLLREYGEEPSTAMHDGGTSTGSSSGTGNA